MSEPAHQAPTLPTPAASPVPSTGSPTFASPSHHLVTSSSTGPSSHQTVAPVLAMEMESSPSSGPDSSGTSSAASELETIIDDHPPSHQSHPLASARGPADVDMLDGSSRSPDLGHPLLQQTLPHPKPVPVSGGGGGGGEGKTRSSKRKDPSAVMVGGHRADGGKLVLGPGAYAGGGWWQGAGGAGIGIEESALSRVRLLDEELVAKQLDFGDPFMEQLQASSRHQKASSGGPADPAPTNPPVSISAPAATTATTPPAPTTTAVAGGSTSTGSLFPMPDPPAGGPLATPLASPKSDR